MPNTPLDKEELKQAIEYIFGYDLDEKGKDEFSSFNRHPEYIVIQDITKKHTVGKSYHAIEKQLLELMQSTVDAAVREARIEELSALHKHVSNPMQRDDLYYFDLGYRSVERLNELQSQPNAKEEQQNA